MPATPSETSVLEHEVRVAARPETVFAYFTDPARMVQWMGTDATLDPRPGGVCRIAFQPSQAAIDFWMTVLGRRGEEPATFSGRAVMLGEFVEVDPHSRIALTWGWEQDLFAMPPQSTAVEVTFTPDDEGTVVRLAHRRLPGARQITFHRAGWQHYLPRLALAATGIDPGGDPFLVVT
jgi:uncharacterized protein YndB with AHSA1/START domain